MLPSPEGGGWVGECITPHLPSRIGGNLAYRDAIIPQIRYNGGMAAGRQGAANCAPYNLAVLVGT